VKNDALYALARVALALVTWMPAAVLRAMGRALGAMAYAVFAPARRTAMANVARVFPELDARARRRLVRRCYATLGAELGNAVARLRGGAAVLPLSDDARTVLESARAEGCGVVFASAHLGPWEAVAASLVAHGVPLTTIARESYDPRLTALYDRLRGGHGVRAIYRGSAGAAARIVRVLRHSGVLGAPMDLRSRVASRDVAFLGHPAPTAVGPARLALRTGAAVVVGTAAPRADGALHVTAARIPTSDLAPGDAGELALTARINDELSRRILALPHAWPWMHARWPAEP
jgi:KDO2-lipid IV(A) lauroyltransferase